MRTDIFIHTDAFPLRGRLLGAQVRRCFARIAHTLEAEVQLEILLAVYGVARGEEAGDVVRGHNALTWSSRAALVLLTCCSRAAHDRLR